MRFFYARKEQVCRYCKSAINYNDEAVVTRWKPPGGITFIPLVVHVTCYVNWITDGFNKAWNDWKIEASPRPVRHKRGRKFLYGTREQAKLINQLKSLRSYHIKVGNNAAVNTLNKRIEEETHGN